MTKQELFAAKVKELLEQSRNMNNDTVANIMLMLDDTEKEIIRLISRSTRSGDIVYLTNLKEQIKRVMDNFNHSATLSLISHNEKMWLSGIESVDIPMQTIGFTRMIPAVDTNVLGILQDYSADLITNLTNDALKQINQEIRSVMLGIKKPYDTMEGIANSLTDKSTFSSIARRAEVITRTEGGRIVQAARQVRAEKAAILLPALQKEWKHSLYVKEPRSGHQEADGYRVSVIESFLIHWEAGMPDEMKESLMYPRDPSGTAKNTINCDCYALDWHPNWDDAVARQNEMDIVAIN